MNVRRSLTRLAALTVVVAMPLAGISGVASAKATKAASPKCVKHPTKPKCQNAGGGATGGATGNGSAQLTVQVDPEPLVETGQSEVHVVIQVESLPSYAGDAVNIDSSQLQASCGTLTFENLQVPGGGAQTVPPTINIHPNRIDAVLDDDGNATVIADGIDCAPGTDVIEADLEVAPFLTGLTTLVVSPPAVTPEGLTVNPRFGGLNQELETGDTSTSGDSNIYAVFYVETNPVYAEQTVEIGSSQLEGRCIEGWVWEAGNTAGVGAGPGVNSPVPGVGVNTGPEVSTILDDDGNAVFIFKGASCASGPSQVIADVEAGTTPPTSPPSPSCRRPRSSDPPPGPPDERQGRASALLCCVTGPSLGRGLRPLSQLDDVSVEVPVSPTAPPGLLAGTVDDPGPGGHGGGVGLVDVVDGEGQLDPGRRGPVGAVEGEVEVGAVGPRDLGVAAPGPAVLRGVVTGVEVHPEALAVEGHGPLQIGDFEDDGLEPPGGHGSAPLGLPAEIAPEAR